MRKKATASVKGGEPPMRKLLVLIPEDVFKALKMRSVDRDITMKELVADALRRYLGLKEGGEKK